MSLSLGCGRAALKRKPGLVKYFYNFLLSSDPSSAHFPLKAYSRLSIYISAQCILHMATIVLQILQMCYIYVLLYLLLILLAIVCHYVVRYRNELFLQTTNKNNYTLFCLHKVIFCDIRRSIRGERVRFGGGRRRGIALGCHSLNN